MQHDFDPIRKMSHEPETSEKRVFKDQEKDHLDFSFSLYLVQKTLFLDWVCGRSFAPCVQPHHFSLFSLTAESGKDDIQ